MRTDDRNNATAAVVLAAMLFPTHAFGQWGLSGNAGTSPARHFIGTTDTASVVFKIGNRERIRIRGGGDTDAGVGIGIADPYSVLHVVGNFDVGGVINGNIEGGLVIVGRTTSGNIAIDNDEIVARNRLAPSTLFLNKSGGNVTVGQGSFTVGGKAFKPGGGSWAALSDRRVKKNVTDFNDGLGILRRVRPVRFQYNGLGGSVEDDRGYVGVVAQELESVAPYMIERTATTLREGDESPVELLAVDPSALTFVLVNAIKEQQRTIEGLQRDLEKLKEIIGAMHGGASSSSALVK